jgi:hypothetical protein
MSITASIGAMQFALVRRREIKVPPLALEPLLLADGMVVQRVERPNSTVLVIDHRSDARPQQRACLELWRPLVGGEGRISSLIILADLREQPPARPVA